MDNGKEIVLSALAHTWILDLDGTLVKHNGYKIDGRDTLLPGAKEFLERIPRRDMIIFMTSREESFKGLTESFLTDNEIRFDRIIYGVPYGERIVINDKKPSGLETAIAVSVTRDAAEKPEIRIEKEL
ncbi:MAG: HAD family acid phosphatase [Firmicutes bacterium]|nr:HAD family acid phosphatase [Bacillota bacterium]